MSPVESFSGVTLPHQSPALLGHRQLCATRGSASAATTTHDQGITGKKCDFTSLPYSKIQAFSIETSGSFDQDTELDLWFSSATSYGGGRL
jgi:hypothetical protein